MQDRTPLQAQLTPCGYEGSLKTHPDPLCRMGDRPAALQSSGSSPPLAARSGSAREIGGSSHAMTASRRRDAQDTGAGPSHRSVAAVCRDAQLESGFETARPRRCGLNAGYQGDGSPVDHCLGVAWESLSRTGRRAWVIQDKDLSTSTGGRDVPGVAALALGCTAGRAEPRRPSRITLGQLCGRQTSSQHGDHDLPRCCLIRWKCPQEPAVPVAAGAGDLDSAREIRCPPRWIIARIKREAQRQIGTLG